MAKEAGKQDAQPDAPAPAQDQGPKSETLRYVHHNHFKGIPKGTEIALFGHVMIVKGDHIAEGVIPDYDVANMIESGRLERV